MQDERESRGVGWIERGFWAVVILTCVRVWLAPGPAVSTAQGVLPNPAEQRNATVQATQRTNQLLVEIRDLLRTHTFKVSVEGTDNKPGARPPVSAKVSRP